MTRLLTVLFPLLLLVSCGTMGNLATTIRESRELAEKINDTVDRIQPEIDEIMKLYDEIQEMGKDLKGDLGEAVKEFGDLHEKSKQEADKDGDGALSWAEMIAYLLGVGGGGTVLLRKYLQRMKTRLVAEAQAAAHEAKPDQP